MKRFVLAYVFAATTVGTAGAFAGCSSSSSGNNASDAGTSSDATSVNQDGGSEDATVDSGVAIPSTTAGDALTFVLAAMNGTKVTGADVTAHFTTDFITAVGGASAIEALFTQLAANKQWVVAGFDGKPTELSLVAIVTQNQAEYHRLSIGCDATTSLIDGLNIDIAPELDPTLQSWDAIDKAIGRGGASEFSELAATIDDDAGCTAIHSLSPDTSRALGSQFKLYVLATLAQSIDTGVHAWTDQIAIQDQYKSLPSGTYQNEPVGTMFSAEKFADQMISVSDNTAADHLIWFVGRSNVESMLTTAQHHDPTQNEPFLTTRELFDLKLMVSEPARQTYIADSIADKRTVLAGYDTTLDPRTYTGTWLNPIDIDQLEWFATPNDLCKVMTVLKTYADKPTTTKVYDVLAINPGIADDAKLFSYIGYKGGSEPGVLTLSWLLKRASDSTWRFYSVEWNDPNNALDEATLVYIAGAGRALLAK